MLTAGTRVGPYEVVTHLGAGGMGQVYRAIDTRLGRTVAIKVLATPISGDATMGKRFAREAKAISSLSHPNICALYDIGRENGFDYLVMEFLDGETLAERLMGGKLPFDEALRYAIDVASALERAHRQGVIHRDLKPGNVMLTKSGAKLLDFGLARFAEGTSYNSSSSPLTSEETLVGTFEYMAPEQLRGEAVDARSDIFAFGVMLYEMLSGARPFGGANRASVIGAILFSTPQPISERNATLPPEVDQLIGACLAKDPDDRIQTAHDLRLQLEWLRSGIHAPMHRFHRRGRVRILPSLGWAVALLLGLAGGAWFANRYSSSGVPPLAFTFNSPVRGGEMDWPAISPDGRTIAFVARAPGGEWMLWLRDLASTVPRLLPGTEGAMQPFWSPDSSRIAFVGKGKLQVVDRAATAAPQPIASVSSLRGASWGNGNQIIYTADVSTPLWITSATGHSPRPLTSLDSSLGDVTHRWPEFLPDGKRFLFVIRSRKLDRSGLYLASLQGSTIKKIAPIQSRTIMTGSGWLLFMREGKLLRQRFDSDRGELIGQHELVADNVGIDLKVTGAAPVSISRDGTLAYLSRADERSELIWVDRSGHPLGRLGVPDHYVNPALSPDGSTLAVSRIDAVSGRNELWLIDTKDGRSSPFVVGDANADSPVWSPSGDAVYYTSDRRGRYEAYLKAVGSVASERLVFPGHGYIQAVSARPSGVLFHVNTPAAGMGYWFWRTGAAKPVRLTSSTEGQADLSPDGQWLVGARTRSHTADYEMFIESVDDPAKEQQVSVGGAVQPVWSADQRVIYAIRAEDRQLIAIPFEQGRLGSPTALFTVPVDNLFYASRDYVPAADGQRFLLLRKISTGDVSTATVVTGWAR